MSTIRPQDYIDGLVGELRKLPEETGWVEFKENYANPEEVGEYLSALSNTAALQGKANGYVQRDPMTNSSLRERFGIAEKNSAMVSRIIREAIEDNLVRPYDPQQGKKYAKYLPFWA